MRGSVFKRGRSWTAQVFLGRDAVTGRKRYRQWGGFPTRRAAEQALTRQLELLRVGDYADAGTTTLGDFLDRWLESVGTRVRPTTAASYRDMLEGHVVPRIGNVRLDQLRPMILSSLYTDLLAGGRRSGTGGLSARTVQYIHRIVSNALSDAVRWNLLAWNPASRVDAPRVEMKEMRTWSAVDVRRFLAGVADDRLFALWLLLCTTGMRRGEALGLGWRDIDFAGGNVAARRQLVEVNYELRYSEPKTARGRRSVALDGYAVVALREHRDRQRKERSDLGALDPAELVFTKLDGTPLQPQNVSQAFGNIIRRDGLPTIRLHDLRHTAASLMLAAGVHPKIVSERLGHAGIQITLDRYSHVTAGLQAEAANVLARAVFEPRPDGDAP
ncbi:MAG TPA: site-specific integrase [Acidimicrobiia bacterium]